MFFMAHYCCSQNLGMTLIGSYNHNLPAGGEVEIIAPFDSLSNRLFANLEKDKITIIDISIPASPDSIGTIDITPYGTLALNVAVGNNLVAVAAQGVTKQDSGKVVFFDINGTFINDITVGPAPGMLSFTPNGRYVVVANEGVPSDDYSIDPEGSVTVIDLINGPTDPVVNHIGFSDYNIGAPGQNSFPEGVHIYGPGATRAMDMEPEFVTISNDGQKAYISLQENNAVMVVEIPSASIDTVFALGYKDHSLPGNELDVSDQDGIINIASYPVFGMYQPDGLAYFGTQGSSYFLTANEGAARKYTAYNETQRISSLGLNPATFANIPILQEPNNLGRLNVTTAFGDEGNDQIMDTLYSYGGRSFSIWDAVTGSLVYDSGNEFESQIELLHPEMFNSEGGSGTFDKRSDNKGPEPEDVVVGKVGNRFIAFIGLEQIGGIMVYDITNPLAPEFLMYEPSAPGDFGPEASVFIDEMQSPNGKPLLVVAHEASSTLAIYEIASNIGIDEEVQDLQFSPYPNPTNSFVTIGNVGPAGLEYSLYTIYGAFVQSKKLHESEAQIDMSYLPQGTYLLKINEVIYKISKID